MIGKPPVFETGKIQLQPMSAFSNDPTRAVQFADILSKGEYKQVMVVRVPVSEIVGTGFSGAGCSGETEMVLLGNQQSASVMNYELHSSMLRNRADRVNALLDWLESGSKLQPELTASSPEPTLAQAANDIMNSLEKAEKAMKDKAEAQALANQHQALAQQLAKGMKSLDKAEQAMIDQAQAQALADQQYALAKQLAKDAEEKASKLEAELEKAIKEKAAKLEADIAKQEAEAAAKKAAEEKAAKAEAERVARAEAKAKAEAAAKKEAERVAKEKAAAEKAAQEKAKLEAEKKAAAQKAPNVKPWKTELKPKGFDKGIDQLSSGFEVAQSTPAEQALEDVMKQKSALFDNSHASPIGEAKHEVSVKLSERLENDSVWQEYVKRMSGVGPEDPGWKLASQETASDLTQHWAYSSGDSNTASLVGQIATQREFGLPVSSLNNGDFGSQAMQEALRRADGPTGKALQAFVRAMYDETQAFFAENNITEVTLYRGMKFYPGSNLKFAGAPNKVGECTLKMQPVSSFSYYARVADLFAGEPSGNTEVVVAVRVPVERILSTARTGYGCLEEREMTVLAGSNDRCVFSAVQRKYDMTFAQARDLKKSIWEKFRAALAERT